MFERIASILRKELNSDFLIEIDGGVNTKTAKIAFEAGAEVFVAGHSVFSADNISAATMELKKIITK